MQPLWAASSLSKGINNSRRKEKPMSFESFSDSCWCREDDACVYWNHEAGECDKATCPRYDDYILFQERGKKETHDDSLEHQKREEGIKWNRK